VASAKSGARLWLRAASAHSHHQGNQARNWSSPSAALPRHVHHRPGLPQFSKHSRSMGEGHASGASDCSIRSIHLTARQESRVERLGGSWGHPPVCTGGRLGGEHTVWIYSPREPTNNLAIDGGTARLGTVGKRSAASSRTRQQRCRGVQIGSMFSCAGWTITWATYGGTEVHDMVGRRLR